MNSNVAEDAVSIRGDARVYIIVLNWNGWRDTIECLESLLRLDYPDYRIIVCDNCSSDGSLDEIRRWARGELDAATENRALLPLTHPPVPKPIPFAEVNPLATTETSADVRLWLMQTEANLGYAGGNNAALRYALSLGDCEFAWLLNNDTVARPDALSLLVQRMKERPDAGMCGSTLIYYDDASKVQAWGGASYNKWLARAQCIGHLANPALLPEAADVEPKISFVVGASVLVRRSLLEEIGLMDERYFLTFEEISWATCARGRFQMAYAPHSIVYHKEGRSTGAHRTHSLRSPLTEFYSTRNRILFTRTHHGLALVTVFCAVGLSAIHRLLHGRWANLRALIRGVLQGLSAIENPRQR